MWKEWKSEGSRKYEKNILSKDNTKFIILIAIIAIGILISFVFGLKDKFSVENILNFIQSTGAWGPLLYMLAYGFTSIIMFPASLLSTASGMI